MNEQSEKSTNKIKPERLSLPLTERSGPSVAHARLVADMPAGR